MTRMVLSSFTASSGLSSRCPSHTVYILQRDHPDRVGSEARRQWTPQPSERGPRPFWMYHNNERIIAGVHSSEVDGVLLLSLISRLTMCLSARRCCISKLQSEAYGKHKSVTLDKEFPFLQQNGWVDQTISARVSPTKPELEELEPGQIIKILQNDRKLLAKTRHSEQKAVIRFDVGARVRDISCKTQPAEKMTRRMFAKVADLLLDPPAESAVRTWMSTFLGCQRKRVCHLKH